VTTFDLIDDLEDNDGLVTETMGRSGKWNSIADEESSGSYWPPPCGHHCVEPFLEDMNKPARSIEGGGTSLYAAHQYGDKHEWSHLSCPLAGGSKYDASETTGISFWAKWGDGPIQTLRILAPNADTDVRGGKMLRLLRRPSPSTSTSPRIGSFTSCRGRPSTSTGSAGRCPPSSIARRSTRSASTAPGHQMNWDFWIDDIAFYTEK